MVAMVAVNCLESNEVGQLERSRPYLRRIFEPERTPGKNSVRLWQKKQRPIHILSDGTTAGTRRRLIIDILLLLDAQCQTAAGRLGLQRSDETFGLAVVDGMD